MANSFSKEERVAFEDILEGFQDLLVLSRHVSVYNTDSTMMERANNTIWRPMPYILAKCTDDEEVITPGSGIFKVTGELVFKSHTKENSPELRQVILDAINNFAYDNTAAKLSAVDNFHCHGWHPTTGRMDVDNEAKASVYTMTYWVYCMAMNDS